MQDLVIVLSSSSSSCLLWRGPKTLPKLGEALGRGVREAKAEAGKAPAENQARAARRADPTGRATRPDGPV